MLACLPEIPAQEEAVLYLQDVADQFPERFLMVGGHSKGGNLAVYAAVQAPESIQDRICAVWSNDGPGFTDEFVHSDAFHRIEHRLGLLLSLLHAHHQQPALYAAETAVTGDQGNNVVSFRYRNAGIIEGLFPRTVHELHEGSVILIHADSANW